MYPSTIVSSPPATAKSTLIRMLATGALTQSEIARRAGCSRQLVSWIVLREHLPIAQIRHFREEQLCEVCGWPFKPHQSSTEYCSQTCQGKAVHWSALARHVVVRCAFCGRRKAIAHRQARSSSGLYFCDHHCQGRWCGKNYGWGKPS